MDVEQIRRATATWSGDLATGVGQVTAASSGAFTGLAVSWPARTEAPDGRTSPEELLAAAHAACFLMSLSSRLAKAGTPPGELAASATVTFRKGEAGWSVAASHLEVRGHVAGATAESFAEVAAQAKDGCPISRALQGNVALSVSATLEP
jgi:osmotically inducible protein OsmC